jgi:hypothetical protein
MKKRAVVFVALLVLVIGGLWLLKRPGDGIVPASPAPISKNEPAIMPELAAPMPSESSVPPVNAPGAAIPPVIRKPDLPPTSTASKRDLADPLAAASFPLPVPPRNVESDPDTARDLDRVSLMLRDYRTLTGENPVGSNAEIMKAMMGGNPKGATLGPPEGMAFNGEGELLDRWGTPYFFHQLTKDLMEIQSAGPDRQRGTDDDVILK